MSGFHYFWESFEFPLASRNIHVIDGLYVLPHASCVDAVETRLGGEPTPEHEGWLCDSWRLRMTVNAEVIVNIPVPVRYEAPDGICLQLTQWDEIVVVLERQPGAKRPPPKIPRLYVTIILTTPAPTLYPVLPAFAPLYRDEVDKWLENNPKGLTEGG